MSLAEPVLAPLRSLLPRAKRYLSALWVAAALLFMVAPDTAQAHRGAHLVWPEIGLGVGRVLTPYDYSPMVQVDFGLGFEFERAPWSPGAIFRFDMLMADDFYRYDLAPMLTYSLGYETAMPFLRAGFGPLVSFSRSRYGVAVGPGAHGELSVGFKSILDLYLNGRFGADAFGPSFALTGGVRVNALIVRFLRHGSRWYHRW